MLESFFLNELKEATRNFHRENLLGEGGFGFVYKGWIDQNSLTAAKPGTGMVIAVKRLNHDGFHGHEEGFVSITYILHFLTFTFLISRCFSFDIWNLHILVTYGSVKHLRIWYTLMLNLV